MRWMTWLHGGQGESLLPPYALYTGKRLSHSLSLSYDLASNIWAALWHGGGRHEAWMAAPECGVSGARWEKYAAAVELLWACN